MAARTLAHLFVVGLGLATATVARADAPPPEAGLAVALVGPPRAPYDGEVLTLDLALTWDAAWLERHGVPFARQPMDLPLRVTAAALAPTARLGAVASPPPAGRPGPSFALGDDVVTDARDEGGAAPRQRLVLRRAFQVHGAGPLELAAPSAQVTWAEQFASGLLGENIAVDPRRATVHGAPLTLDVRALPSEGRPAGFEGLIGRYTLAATSRPVGALSRETEVVLTLAGAGNHAVLPAPRFAVPAGWQQTARLEERTPEGWKLTLTLETHDPAVEIDGAWTFATWAFDPENARYVDVSATIGPPQVADAGSKRPSTTPAPGTTADGDARPWALALLLVVGIAWLAVRSLRRTARERRVPGHGPRHDPGQEARRAARARLLELADTPAAGPALLGALALHLGVAEAALVDARLGDRLRNAGLDAATAAEVAHAVEAWIASRYAGPAAAPSRVARALAERLVLQLEARDAT